MLASFINLPDVANGFLAAAIVCAVPFVLTQVWRLVGRVRSLLRDSQASKRRKAGHISELLSVTAGGDYAPHAVSYVQFELDRARNLARDLSSMSVMGTLFTIAGLPMATSANAYVLAAGVFILCIGAVSLLSSQVMSFIITKEVLRLERAAKEAFRAILFAPVQPEKLPTA